MTVNVGLVSTTFGSKQAFDKEVATKKEAYEVVKKFITGAMMMGWMPTYVLVDGVQCLKIVDENKGIYKIEVN